MSSRNRMHVAAVIQRGNERLFRKVYDAYAKEHSNHVAQYMANTLLFWDTGKVDIQPSSLDRFDKFDFPDVSHEEARKLISFLYEEYKSEHREVYSLDFRIEFNIEEKIKELTDIVEFFDSDAYDSELAWTFRDGIAWICQNDLERAQAILHPYAQQVGKQNYAAVRAPVNEFLQNLKDRALPIPYEQMIELPYGYLHLDYNYRFRKRIRNALISVGRKILTPWWWKKKEG